MGGGAPTAAAGEGHHDTAGQNTNNTPKFPPSNVIPLGFNPSALAFKHTGNVHPSHLSFKNNTPGLNPGVPAFQPQGSESIPSMKSKDAALIPMLELTLNQLDHYGSRYEPAQAKAMVASCLTGNQYMRGYIENTKTCKDWQFAYEQQLRAIEVFHSKRTSGKPNKRPEEQVKHEKTAEILKDANIEMRLKRSADTKDYDELKIPQVAVKTDGIRNFGEAMRTLDQVVAFLGTFPVSEQERDIIESKFSSLRALWGKAGEEFMVVKEQSVDKGKGKTMDEAGDGLKPGSLDTSAAAGRIQHIVGEMKGMTLQIKSQQVQEQQDDDWIEVKHEEDDKGAFI